MKCGSVTASKKPLQESWTNIKMKTLTKLALTAGLILGTATCTPEPVKETLRRLPEDFTTTCFVEGDLGGKKLVWSAMHYKNSSPDSARHYQVSHTYSFKDGKPNDEYLTITDESGKVVYNRVGHYPENTSRILSLSLTGKDLDGFGLDGNTRPDTYMDKVKDFASDMEACNFYGNPNLDLTPAH